MIQVINIFSALIITTITYYLREEEIRKGGDNRILRSPCEGWARADAAGAVERVS